MNSLLLALRLLRRELSGGDLRVLLTALVLAVAAATTVGFFTDRVGQAIRQQASAVLAADLVIRSPAPLSDRFLDEAQALGLATARLLSFPSVVLDADDAEGEAVLATIDAVTEGYPLRGEVKTSAEMFGEAAVAQGIPVAGEAWAAPGLMARLGVEVGATIEVGNRSLRISRILEYQPGQGVGMGSFAPPLLVNMEDVASMEVLRPGSRVSHRQLFAGSEAALSSFRRSVAAQLDSEAIIRDQRDAGEQISIAIDRAERFLVLSSLVTVILAAVATAMAARVYALRRLDMVAILKSLGAGQRFLERLFSVQLLTIILGSTLIGTLLGVIGQAGLARLSSGFLGISLPGLRLLPAWLGVLTALTVVMGFALPQLWQLRSVTPLRVLRRDLPVAGLPVVLSSLLAVMALLGMIAVLVRDLLLVGLVAAGLLALMAAAGLAAWLLVMLTARLRGMAGVAWRHGLANIARRGPESVVQVVGFGLGLMVLLLLGVVRGDLLAAWERSVPADAPNYFLINIDPPSWPSMQRFIAQELGESPDSLPFIRGRLTAINGEAAEDLAARRPAAADFLEREQNLSWAAELPVGNHIQQGSWWSPGHAGPPQLSLEEDIAVELGVELGDILSFSVGGETIDARLSNIRSVDWESFAPNFFLMLSPGVAGELPQTLISSFHVPAESRPMLAELVRRHPGVTVFDIEAILSQVRSVMERASLAIQYVFLFTLLAGVVLVLSAVQVTRDERRAEAAILRALGAGRRLLLRSVIVEFGMLGMLGGLLAAAGAAATGYLLASRVFELSFRVNPWLWPAGLLLGGVLVGAVGWLAMRQTLRESPVTVLRGL